MINKKFIVIVLLFVYEFGYSQSDTSLLKRLNRPIKNCEIIATNSQEIISLFNYEQFDSISQVIKFWKNECGNIEPIQRIQILLDIQSNRFNDTVYNDYIKEYIYKYEDRISTAKDDKYREIYESNKGYFDYVPLNGKLDEWTKSMALKLLDRQRLGTSQYFYCLLLSNQFEQFDNELYKKENSNNYLRKKIEEENHNTFTNEMSFTLVSGTWIPFGKLSHTLHVSPLIGLYGSLPIQYKNFRIDFGLMLKIPVNYQKVKINVNDTIIDASCRYGSIFGGQLCYQYPLNDKLFLDGMYGIYVDNYFTDIKKPNPKSDNDDFYYFGTVNMTFGLGIRKSISKKSSLGTNINFHFLPYNTDKILITDLNGNAMTINLIFRY